MSAPPQELVKISELAERADVPVATVRHYLREGLLPEGVKTSRNMAYYPPEFVDRIRLIKQLYRPLVGWSLAQPWLTAAVAVLLFARPIVRCAPIGKFRPAADRGTGATPPARLALAR